jgi:hypothetical protein
VNGVESRRPVAVGIRVFAAEPMHEIAVNEVEAEQGDAEL